MYLGHGHIIPQSKVGNTYLPDELFIDTVLHLPVPPPPMDPHLYELSMHRPTSIDLQPFLFPGSFDVKFGANLSQGELEIVQGLDTKVFRDANMQRIGAYKVERVIDILRADSKSSLYIEYAACVNMLSEKIILNIKTRDASQRQKRRKFHLWLKPPRIPNIKRTRACGS